MENRRSNNKLNLAMDESGAAAVVIAIIFTVLCGFGALAFDIGHMVMVKAELQRTVDAAALAGAMSLVPYNDPGINQMPNWAQGESKAHDIIHESANQSDNHTFSITDGTIIHGYWLLKPPANYVQPKQPPDTPLPVAGPFAAGSYPEPAINVTLSKNVDLYLAPLIGISGQKTVSATATAILPEGYCTTGIPPIAVDTDTVYNTDPNGTLTIDLSEQTVKPQSNKGAAGWFNLSGDNSVPSVRINAPLTSAHDQIYMVPGTKATLMDFVTEGETIVLPIVDDLSQKEWKDIVGWAAFKVDVLNANSMEGHFVNKYYDPNVIPTADAGTPTIYPSALSGTPKLVGP